MPLRTRLAGAKGVFRAYRKPGVSVVEELLAERRQEAVQETAAPEAESEGPTP
ncbi:MAG: hypothetical protein K6V97_04275 [Actinomycetia bacterium]|nr:hypothetical protein [Actinomycetes bacterium]